MEFVEGDDLERVLSKGKLGQDKLLDVFEATATT